MTAAVRLHHVWVSFGPRAVLEDLSLSVPAGSFFIIIGPNSAGKTTLARTIAGAVPPQGGVVEVLGRPLAAYTKKALAQVMAMVPQTHPLEVPFTVQEMVLMGRSPHLSLVGLESRRDLEVAAQAMHLTDVAHLAGRRFHQLSGGERQRVIIARALCQQPQILILDEPTASLDPAHQIHLMDLLERLQQEHRLTIIMISHDLNLAAMYADHLLLLHQGRVACQGPPSEVLTYEHLEAAYGCVLLVGRNPLLQRPQVTLVPRRCMEQVQK